MVIDTSALLAILKAEPEAGALIGCDGPVIGYPGLTGQCSLPTIPHISSRPQPCGPM